MSIDSNRKSAAAPGSTGQPVYVMYPPDQERRIDLIALLRLIWEQKWLISGVTFLFVAAGMAYTFVATPVYRAECLLAPNKAEQMPNLASSLGGLANLAGINLGASPDTTDAVATLRSRVFIEEFIQENDLMPVLFADDWDAANERWVVDDPEDVPDIQEGVQFFIDELRSVNEDPSTGLITLAIEWADAQLTADWVNDLVRRINERLRTRDLMTSERRLAYLYEQLENAKLVELRQAISRLIESEIQTMTLARAETEYAFKVIDPPRVPNKPISPRRLAIILVTFLIGGMIGLSIALLRGWTSIIHNESAADERG